jgi:hypothetical protein
VERSEPFDAWDEGDDPLDMSLYGPAPLPAHERAWRHPSEMGQNAWMLTEPPVAIGRGLLVTTGAIGCVLGIAVLWLLVPVGGGLAPSAAPTVTSSTSTVRTVVTSTTETPARTDLVNDAPTSVPAQVVITLPSEEPPVNTVLVTRPKAPETSAVAVAVSNGDAPFIVTTANAVADNDGFSMVGTGDPTDGSVMSIEGNLAYLSSHDELDVVGFTETASAEVGEMVTVLGQEQTPVQFVDDGAVVELDAALVREGTPVIDESGALVALCTLVQTAEGSYVALVPIGGPPAEPTVTTPPESTVPAESTTTTTTVPGTSTTTTIVAQTAWAGIKFGEVDPSATPAVTGVIADSPAAVGGLAAGDQIMAVDDVAVTRVEEVLAAIKAKRPGDTIVFKVSRITPAAPPTDGTTSSTSSSVPPVERLVTVVLGVYEPAV